MAREYLIDSKLFYNYVANLAPEERGRVFLNLAIAMNTDNADYDFIREKPKPRGRQKKEKKIYNQGYTWEFDEFWKCYPKKVAKAAAFAVWQDLDEDKGELLRSCLEALTWQRESKSWRDGYIPNGENYLAKRQWEDENPEPAKTGEWYVDMDGIRRQR